MTTQRQDFGESSESAASRYLQAIGYEIIARNYRNYLGEIDIIARDKNTIVFVEVKARRSGDRWNPKAAVTWAKKRKVSMVALHYLKKTNNMNKSARFDVVAIQDQDGEQKIELVKNAFELAYR